MGPSISLSRNTPAFCRYCIRGKNWPLFYKRGRIRMCISETAVITLARHTLRFSPLSLGALPSRHRHQHLSLGTLRPRQESGFARGVDYAPRRSTARLLSSESKHLITVLCEGSWISLIVYMWQLLKKSPFFSKKMHRGWSV